MDHKNVKKSHIKETKAFISCGVACEKNVILSRFRFTFEETAKFAYMLRFYTTSAV